MQESVINLFEKIVKNNGNTDKITLYEFEKIFERSKAVDTFLRTGLPFDFAESVTAENIKKLAGDFDTIREECRTLLEKNTSSELWEKLEKQYKKFNFRQSLKNYLIDLFLTTLCAEHVELMGKSTVVTEKRKLLASIIAGSLKPAKLKKTREGSRRIKNSQESLLQDGVYQYIKESPLSQLEDFRLFDKFVSQEKFMANLGKNGKTLFTNKKIRDSLVPPYSQQSIKLILDIINSLREDIIQNADYLDLLDDKLAGLTNPQKIEAIYNFMGSYVSKVFSLFVLGHPKASQIMYLFLATYPYYDNTDQPSAVFNTIAESIGKQQAHHFFELSGINSLIEKSKYQDDSDAESEEEGEDLITPSTVFHAIQDLASSPHINYIKSSLLEEIKTLKTDLKLALLKGCIEISSSSLNQEFNENENKFFNQLYQMLDTDISAQKEKTFSSPKISESAVGVFSSSSSSSSSSSPRSVYSSASSSALQIDESPRKTLISTKSDPELILPEIPDDEDDSDSEYSGAESEVVSPRVSPKKKSTFIKSF